MQAKLGNIIVYLSCSWQNDVNVCARQDNWQCERFACSRQKGMNDKTPMI